MKHLYKVHSFPYSILTNIKAAVRPVGNQKTTDRTKYKDVVCAFDIETTNVDSGEYSFMYLWLFQIGRRYTIIGRTWDEFRLFTQQLEKQSGGCTYCIYVHNLSFEFQYLKGVFKFTLDDVFAVDTRKILKVKTRCFEFRCSYIHSNMSLSEFTRKMKVKHQKLSGSKYDYNKIRYPWTPLRIKELQYGIHDVLGLVEAIETEMAIDGDTLYTIPLTSTGYVRREIKAALKPVYMSRIRPLLPNPELYRLLREAFRGGDTHANRYYAGMILENVRSYDRSSSYPDVQCNCEYPVKPFTKIGVVSLDCFHELVYKRGKATIFRVAFANIRLKDIFWCDPYLSRDKCRRVEKGVYDNGRILEAEYLETTLTDVDARIIFDTYAFDEVAIFDLHVSTYGVLPKEYIEQIERYYMLKTSLKNVEGQDVYYMKSKNKLNAIYGMSAQNPVRDSIVFNGIKLEAMPNDADVYLEKNGKKATVPYQWGVWCTAWARYRLYEGLHCVGDAVYWDTDSIKYFGEGDFSKYNRERLKASTKTGAYATDKRGDVHYMGVFEDEGVYSKFVTLGAKKYCYEKDGELVVTTAGVVKVKEVEGQYISVGGRELLKYGGIEAYKPGFVFREAGGTESKFNDEPEERRVSIDGKEIEIVPNVYICDSTYTLGIQGEYAMILENSKKLLQSI